MKNPLVRILVIFVAVLLGSGLLVYVLLERSGGPGSGAVTDPVATTEGQPVAPTGSPSPTARARENDNRSVRCNPPPESSWHWETE